MTSSGEPQSPNGVCPLLNGMQLPTLVLNTAGEERVPLGARLKTKPLVIVFYRGGW